MSHSHNQKPDPYHDTYSKTVFGFWIFLLTDFVLFGTLFATYLVLIRSQPISLKGLFNVDGAFWQTLYLLMVSLFVGLGGALAHRKDKKGTILSFTAAFIVGIIFMTHLFHDSSVIIDQGRSWTKNGVMSGYFTIIGTFMLHMILGLLWMPVLLWSVFKEGISQEAIRRLSCLRMFMQFLTIVWLFVFAIVFLMSEAGI